MIRYTIILDSKAHSISEALEIPDFGPDSDGNPILAIDISNRSEVQEGWDYNAQTDTFLAPIIPEPQSFRCYAILDEYNYVIDIRDVLISEVQPESSVLLSSYDTHVIGCQYIDGEFITLGKIYAMQKQILELLKGGTTKAPKTR